DVRGQTDLVVEDEVGATAAGLGIQAGEVEEGDGEEGVWSWIDVEAKDAVGVTFGGEARTIPVKLGSLTVLFFVEPAAEAVVGGAPVRATIVPSHANEAIETIVVVANGAAGSSVLGKMVAAVVGEGFAGGF